MEKIKDVEKSARENDLVVPSGEEHDLASTHCPKNGNKHLGIDQEPGDPINHKNVWNVVSRNYVGVLLLGAMQGNHRRHLQPNRGRRMPPSQTQQRQSG